MSLTDRRLAKAFVSDWTEFTTKPLWSVVTCTDGSYAPSLRWVGYADNDEQAQAAALRTVKIARNLAHATGIKASKGDSDVILSCIEGENSFPEITLCTEITGPEILVKRRQTIAPNSLSLAAEAATLAVLRCAAARAKTDGREWLYADVKPADERSKIEAHVATRTPEGFLIGYHDMPAALEDALSACAIAHWMSGAIFSGKRRDLAIPGHGSATLVAAEAVKLAQDAPENLTKAVWFLNAIRLPEEARAFQATYGA